MLKDLEEFSTELEILLICLVGILKSHMKL